VAREVVLPGVGHNMLSGNPEYMLAVQGRR